MLAQEHFPHCAWDSGSCSLCLWLSGILQSLGYGVTAFKLPGNTTLILFISALTQGVVQQLLRAAYMLPRPLP